MKKFGIDVSAWQGEFDFASAKKEGVEFAILKAGGGDDGLYADSKFERNYKECKALGIKTGCYWFMRAEDEATAKKEAEYFLNLIKGKQFEYPVAIDVENTEQLSIGADRLSKLICVMGDIIEKQGYYVSIYTSESYFNSYMDSTVDRFDKWVAAWATTPPDCNLWQFGGSTNFIRSNRVAGQVCDQDYAFVDYEAIIKAKGLNGYKSSASSEQVATPAKKSVSEIAKEVWAGKWGNGDERQKKLEAAGYNYEEVQKEVERINPNKTESVVHTVKSGETLSGIASKYGTTWQALAKLNNLSNPDLIFPDQKIKIK